MTRTIILVTTQPFPFGMASTNRLRSLAVGLNKNGLKVRVLCLKPTSIEENLIFLGDKNCGRYEGVDFEYTSITIRDSKSKPLKAIYIISGVLCSIIRILRLGRVEKINQIWVSFSTVAYILTYFVVAKLVKSQFTLFRSEYPKLERNKLTMFLFDKLYSQLLFKCFDNFVIMTTKLKEYFDDKKKSDAKSILAPMTLDFSKYEFQRREIRSNREYIAYCGTMNFNKDGVDNLLRAFKLISVQYPNLFLYLIGDLEGSRETLDLIDELEISDKVIGTGYVTGDTYLNYLSEARVLCLARPKTPQNENGFPSKLIDYLATGKPVVTTDTGEVSKYFKDDESIFFATAGDYMDFAKKLLSVLENYDHSLSVGVKGRQVAMKNFDYISVTKRIISNLF
ncbi:MAG: glycosyltransferase [Ignavibacteria bacterium]|nr:glycosyltransferase [Ignavibacteria bacterium]